MTNTKEITVNTYYNKNAIENIFITNLNAYNSGELFGVWVSLPQDDETLSNIINYISRDGKDELFITDFEGAFHVNEYDDIETLNEQAQEFEELDEDTQAIVKAYIEQVSDDFEEALEAAEDAIIIYDDGGSTNLLIGYYFAIECGRIDIPEDVEPYFDYEAYGRDINFDYSIALDDENIYLFR